MQKLISFFTYDIWHLKLDTFPRWQRGAIRLARIVIMSTQEYATKRLDLRSAALTLFTLLSIVPVIAMIFGIAKGFGLEEYLSKQIQLAFASQPVVVDNLLDYVHNLLGSVQGGIVAFTGFMFLLYVVVSLIGSIEDAFNNIWDVTIPRTWTRKFTDYLSIMFIAPLFIVLSGVITVYVATQIKEIAQELQIFGDTGSKLILFSLNVLPYISTIVLLFFMYLVLPNTKVKPKAAWYASIVAGIVFQIFQWGYVEFQLGVSRYNAIYGSFASVPLFIIWLQFSWMIILVGCEIAHAVQNVSNFESAQKNRSISQRSRMLNAIYILQYIAAQYKQRELPPAAADIATKLSLPHSMVRNLLDWLVQANLVLKAETDKKQAYVPACETAILSLAFVVSKLIASGDARNEAEANKVFEHISAQYGQLEQAMMQSPENVNILEIQ